MDKEILLAKPLSYMNLSGRAVAYLASRFGLKSNDLCIIYDDIDLPLGTIRIRKSGSAGAHRGMQSVINAFNSDNLCRIRIGIRPDFAVDNLAAYVLSPLKKNLLPDFEHGVRLAAEAVEEILRSNINKAMNIFNKKPLASQNERLSNRKEEQ